MHIGFWELIVVFVVALLVVGPDKLPYYAKKLGEALQSFRNVSNELTNDLQKGVVEPLQEAQKPLRDAVQPLTDLTDEVNANLHDLEKSVKDLGKPIKPTPKPDLAAEPPAATGPAGAEAPEPPADPAAVPQPALAKDAAPDMNYADGI